jgi:hypothetical protein
MADRRRDFEDALGLPCRLGRQVAHLAQIAAVGDAEPRVEPQQVARI